MKQICLLFLLCGLIAHVPAQDATSSGDLRLELVTKVDPIYPSAAQEKKLAGEVLVKLEIAESGTVENALVVNGDALLGAAAVSAAKQWTFKPFTRDGKPTKVSFLYPFKFKPPAIDKGRMIIKVIPTTQERRKPESRSDVNEQRDAASETAKPVKVSQNIMSAFVIQGASPTYPAAARNARIQGSVALKVLIGPDGSIKHLEPITGPEQLRESAMDTVRQWKYRPLILDDKPVEVETVVTINYMLAG